MLKYSKEDYAKFLRKFCQESCQESDCILRAFLTRMQPDVRMLVQLKCLEYFASEQADEISREELMKKWIETGLAKNFSEVYDEFTKNKNIDEIDAKELYLAVTKGVRR